MRHVNKNTTSEKWKFASNNYLGLKRTMNGLEKPFRKKSDPKQNKSKNQSEIAASEQTLLARKRIFVQTPISHSTLSKISAKKFHAAKPLVFSLHFLFRRDQNHYRNMTSKIMKMCVQILKKTAPQYNSNSLNCKKPKAPQYSSTQLTALHL